MAPSVLDSSDVMNTLEHELTAAPLRSTSATLVDVVERHADGRLVLRIVADDRPGFFSQVTAALVARAVDVVDAHAMRRVRDDGLVEAVGLLTVRRLDGASDIDGTDIAATIDGSRPGHGVDAPPPRDPATVRIRFGSNERGVTVLTIETVDRPGLLLAVTNAVFRARLQIVGIRARSENGRAMDRLELAEVDGTPLTRERVLELQASLLGAVTG